MDNIKDTLPELICLNISKMNILEAELEATQNLLVGLFVEEGNGKQKTFRNIRENFKLLRDKFEKRIKALGLDGVVGVPDGENKQRI